MAAFGTTYCAVSRLPIQDGDKCILIPLGFRMDYGFGENSESWTSEPDGLFMYLHHIRGAASVVTYGGNPGVIEYDEPPVRNAPQSRMLIHKGFWDEIQEKYKQYDAERCEDISWFRTTHGVYEQTRKIIRDRRLELSLDALVRKKEPLTPEQYRKFDKDCYSTPVPDWVVQIYRLAYFMDKIGAVPYPNQSVDQNMTYEVFEKIRAKFATDVVRHSEVE